MKQKMLAAALALALCGTAHADDAALKDEVATLRAELAALKAEVAAMRGHAAAPVATAAPAAAAAPVAQHDAYAHNDESATTLTGYGELNYNHPFGDAGSSQADLRRAVIGFTHRIADTTRVIGEFEWEHAVTSADDAGEAAVEQLLVEHELQPNLGVRAGLMLIPMG